MPSLCSFFKDLHTQYGDAVQYIHQQLHADGNEELVANFQSILKNRRSSHDSCVQQYSFSGPVISEVLMGVSVDKEGNKRTWIQFEKHNMRTIIGIIMHLIDYLQHKFTGKNIGPYGESEYTDRNPFVVRPGQ